MRTPNWVASTNRGAPIGHQLIFGCPSARFWRGTAQLMDRVGSGRGRDVLGIEPRNLEKPAGSRHRFESMATLFRSFDHREECIGKSLGRERICVEKQGGLDQLEFHHDWPSARADQVDACIRER